MSREIALEELNARFSNDKVFDSFASIDEEVEWMLKNDYGPLGYKEADIIVMDKMLGREDISEEMTAIMKTIMKFEKSDRADRHSNPGALAVKTEGISQLIQDLWHKFHLFPDYGDTFGDGEYSTLGFEKEEDGMIALRYVVGNILENTVYNPNKPNANISDFVSTYIGLPKDSAVVVNYTSDIINNLQNKYKEGE